MEPSMRTERAFSTALSHYIKSSPQIARVFQFAEFDGDISADFSVVLDKSDV